MFDNIFKLKENGTTAKTEIGAGLTTFMTMAYILAVNPSILGAAGMDTSAVLIATCLASFVGSACMALLANLPVLEEFGFEVDELAGSLAVRQAPFDLAVEDIPAALEEIARKLLG